MHKYKQLKYLKFDRDRHGNVRVYLRRPSAPKIRLRAAPGTPEFLDEYYLALRGERPADPKARPPGRRVQENTFGWLVSQYLRASQFVGKSKNDQRNRKQILLSCCDELLNPVKHPNVRIGDCPLSEFGSQVVRLLRDRKAGLPGAANNRRKYISAVFGWAIEEQIAGITTNPCRDVKSIRMDSTGFHTWTMEEVRQYENRHPVGSMARLALALLLYTGARRQDAVEFGRQHIGEDGWLRYRPRKTSTTSGKMVDIPVLPALRAVIDASPCGDLTFLQTEYGKPFTANGFGGWIRKRCDEAGLPECTAHGLRKAGAAIAAENGATTAQLMAIFGWTTIEQAETYTREANRKRLAGEGMKHIMPS